MARRLILSAVLSLVGACPATARTDTARADHGPCLTLGGCRAELARARAAVAWQRSVRLALERRLHVRFVRDLVYSARLAAVTYGVPAGGLLSVAACESHGNLHARNRSSGAAGPMQFMPSTWRHNAYGRAGFSVDDPVAALLGAARVVRADHGYGQWVCQP